MFERSSARFVGAGVLSLALVGCALPRHRPSTGADTTAIRRDIAYLASDRLEGRGTGTAGNDTAAAYIAARYRVLGLRALTPGYQQPFVARSIALAHAGRPSELPTQNVIAVIPGTDAALRNEYVVIGAHYDHLGRSSDGALDPELPNAIHNGADDNASGTAAVMELARLFKRHPTRRSLLFVNFSGEELGVLGSQHFVESAPVPMSNVDAMLNFDMVGRMRSEKLIVYGVETAKELRGIVDSANIAGLRITAQGDGDGPSDHASFYMKNVPVLHFFTDSHEDYHKASDDVDKVNVAGEARVVELAERVARSIADRPARLTFVRTPSRATTMSASREGPQVYLGSVPDMAASEVPGVRLTGVRPGSPADLAGLRTGDVIVELGGRAVKDLYEYSEALYSHKPGDEVSIVVMRAGMRVEVKAVLGKR